MKYAQERKASEETLRLVIQRMAVHPAAFTPHAYAVWYEHLLGINPALSIEIGQLLDSNKQLDDEVVAHLHELHVSENRHEINRILREDIKHLLGKLIDVAADTQQHAESFGSSLQMYGDQLRVKPDALILDDMITHMASDTETMLGSITHLNSELESSKEDVGKLQQELESARREALIDPLTGIFNRRGFEVEAEKALTDGSTINKEACLLMLDIDHFKTINDTYGHLFGDKVLATLVDTLKSKLRGQDSIGRLGGEEFAVLLPETNLQGACAVAEHVRSSIEKMMVRRPNTGALIGDITVSIGIAVYHDGNSWVEWLDMADQALYVSKRIGRNKVSVYETPDTLSAR